MEIKNHTVPTNQAESVFEYMCNAVKMVELEKPLDLYMQVLSQRPAPVDADILAFHSLTMGSYTPQATIYEKNGRFYLWLITPANEMRGVAIMHYSLELPVALALSTIGQVASYVALYWFSYLAYETHPAEIKAQLKLCYTEEICALAQPILWVLLGGSWGDKQMSDKGIRITINGDEGAGSTTLAVLMREALLKNGFNNVQVTSKAAVSGMAERFLEIDRLMQHVRNDGAHIFNTAIKIYDYGSRSHQQFDLSEDNAVLIDRGDETFVAGASKDGAPYQGVTYDQAVMLFTGYTDTTRTAR